MLPLVQDANGMAYLHGNGTADVDTGIYEGHGNDDYLVSPKIQLKGGADYRLKFETYDNWFTNEYMTVLVGKHDKVTGDEIVVKKFTDLHNNSQYSMLFSVPEDGDYYLMLHADTPGQSMCITLDNLGISCSEGGKRIDRYACSSELKYTTGTQVEGIGTFCHEFSHVLGLPDMYNTYQSNSSQLGRWDVMDQGNYNNESHTPPSMSAFERASLGWMQLEEIDTPADEMTLDEMTTSGVAYRISTADPNEYFTLENRQQVGWDAYQPGRGLMVMHITYEQSAWNGNYVNAGTYPRYDLVEADGTQGNGEASDLFPTATNNMFTDYSSPNSLSRSGVPTEKGLTNIRDNDGVISFTFIRHGGPAACSQCARLCRLAQHLCRRNGEDGQELEVITQKNPYTHNAERHAAYGDFFVILQSEHKKKLKK